MIDLPTLYNMEALIAIGILGTYETFRALRNKKLKSRMNNGLHHHHNHGSRKHKYGGL